MAQTTGRYRQDTQKVNKRPKKLHDIREENLHALDVIQSSAERDKPVLVQPEKMDQATGRVQMIRGTGARGGGWRARQGDPTGSITYEMPRLTQLEATAARRTERGSHNTPCWENT